MKDYLTFEMKYENWRIQAIGLCWAIITAYNTATYGWKTGLALTIIVMTIFDIIGYKHYIKPVKAE